MMKEGTYDWENKNARYVADDFKLHFKICPRRFLKTDVPAKAPRRDCPFRSRYGGGHCILPSGFKYLFHKIGATAYAPTTKLICYLDSDSREENEDGC